MKHRVRLFLQLTVVLLLVLSVLPLRAAGAQESLSQKQDIVDTADAAGDFTVLVGALETAGLVDTLKEAGPFTVFAPTDDAFNAIPEDTMAALMADPEALQRVLLYHVVPGRLIAALISDGKEVATAEGSTVTFSFAEGVKKVNDATIVTRDVQASNGVIHVIDAVLMPADMAEAMGAAMAAAPAEATPEATEEATPEATPEATEEATPEATPEATEEAMMEEGPAVSASDQSTDGTTVIVDSVTAVDDGWMVIHLGQDGKPGPVLGQTAVPAGTTENVVVALDPPLEAGTELWAMLHVDAGTAGTYEFPGPDAPVTVDGAIVMMPFLATVEAMAEAAEATPEATEEAMAEATPEATEEAMAEATPEATEEAMAEATPEATEEAMAEATPEATEEAMAEATPEATEEAMMEEATPEATEEAMMEEAEAPEKLPVTGGESNGLLALLVAAIVLVAGAGALYARRRLA
ncbi:MAG: fasciclin domain-containing protein [Caldilineaceae bacterium]|nr:fasciclin domain-containing protein [Caldilineaceae bacterium]